MNSSTTDETKSLTEWFIAEAEKRGLMIVRMPVEGGWPSWMVLAADGIHHFVGILENDDHPTDHQLQRVAELDALGHPATWVESDDEVGRLLDSVAGRLARLQGEGNRISGESFLRLVAMK